jgi:cephalosporin-C deacetylase
MPARLTEPEDYGLDAERTLDHRIEAPPPADFDAHWARFRDEVAALPRRWRSAIGGVRRLQPETAVVPIPSTRGHTIYARVSLPTGPPAGAVVLLHGAGASAGFSAIADDGRPPGLPGALVDRGLSAIEVRVRGFAPSTEITGEPGPDWILQGLESPEGWIVRGAVADVMQVARCACSALGGDTPLLIAGESLGGGLAVIAAAQLAQMGGGVQRLAIGLPSLGDWRWREGRRCTGSGGLINERLVQLREDADLARRTLDLHDAALHARFVDVPCLAKLAQLDEVVPAPSAAAAINALSSPELWRYSVRYGHFDGGLADLRRHAAFERLLPDWLDPRCAPDPGTGVERRDGVHGRWIS